MTDIKATVAKNIAELRKAAGMTQFDLAEKLNYSDKAVSKWERAESLPDVQTLLDLADLFGVTLDALVREGDVTLQTKNGLPIIKRRSNKPIIACLGVLLVWLIAMAVFVILSLSAALHSVWLAFVAAVPVSAIVGLVFNSIWFNPRKNYLFVSVLMWSLLAFLHLLLFVSGHAAWMLYLLGIPGQLIIFVWSRMRFGKKK